MYNKEDVLGARVVRGDQHGRVARHHPQQAAAIKVPPRVRCDIHPQQPSATDAKRDDAAGAGGVKTTVQYRQRCTMLGRTLLRGARRTHSHGPPTNAADGQVERVHHQWKHDKPTELFDSVE